GANHLVTLVAQSMELLRAAGGGAPPPLGGRPRRGAPGHAPRAGGAAPGTARRCSQHVPSHGCPATTGDQ
ncbi:hypothetical protein ACFW15_19320, partial [Streptomyces sp. NPDC058953]